MLALDEDVRWILGRPNFTCRDTAILLRLLGHDIKTKSEDEQAATIHWMLCLYEEHGDKWREEGNKILKAAAQKAIAKAKTDEEE